MAILPGVPEDLAAFAPPRASAVPLPGGAPVRSGGGMGGGGKGVAPQGGGEDSLNAFMYQNRMGTTGKLSVTAAIRGGPTRHMR